MLPDGGFDSNPLQSLAVENGCVLAVAVAVIDEVARTIWLAGIWGLLQGVQQVCSHAGTYLPVDDP
jgi:hypothetical protein